MFPVLGTFQGPWFPIGSRRRAVKGFTLLELLVVIAIIALLLGIVLPVMGKARESARKVRCSSSMRQWGIALGVYQTDWLGLIPKEAGEGAGAVVNTDPEAWFNALPPLVNQMSYGDVYNGQSVGDQGGYDNNWIWYCPTRLGRQKNSASGKNSFHYALNAVLNGTSEFGPNLGQGANGQKFTCLGNVPNQSTVVVLVESLNQNPQSPADGGTMDRTRHSGFANYLFADSHIASLRAENVPEPIKDPDDIWRSHNPTLAWGPFRN